MSFQEPPPHPSGKAGAPAPAAPQPVAPPPPVTVPYAPPVVVETKTGPGLLARAAWFVFVGWWLTGIVCTLAWFAMATLLGLPLGVWLINRVPSALTLRPRTTFAYAWVDGTGRYQTTAAAIHQPPWWARGLWFLAVGWWASALVMAIAYGLIVLIVTIPLGILLINRVPFVASLYRY